MTSEATPDFKPGFEGSARKARDSFASHSMMHTLGAELSQIAPGLCVVRAPILPGSRQQHGYGHAGLTFSIGDTAAGYAAMTLMPEEKNVLTVEMKINLLAPAQGAYLIATGRVIRPGRRLIVVQAEVTAQDKEDADATPIALMQGTIIAA